jgi:hypothetical protein
MPTMSSTWPELLGHFFQIFTKPSAKVFLHLVTGWVLCTARRTITGILPFADPVCQRAHDAYHRFFPDARWALSQLWRTLTLILVACSCPIGVISLALDNTLFHHTGREINGAGYWRDAVRSTQRSLVYAWGLNLVVLTLQIHPPVGRRTVGIADQYTVAPKRTKDSDRTGGRNDSTGLRMAAGTGLEGRPRRFLWRAGG